MPTLVYKRNDLELIQTHINIVKQYLEKPPTSYYSYQVRLIMQKEHKKAAYNSILFLENYFKID